MNRPWPIDPLLDMLDCATAYQLAAVIGVPASVVAYARDRGLTDEQADEWATRARLHPSQIWPDWIDAGLHPLDVLALYGTTTALPGWRPAYEWTLAHKESACTSR